MHHKYVDREMVRKRLGAGFQPLAFILRYEMRGKKASQKELADFMGITQASLTASIKRMEKAGLVEKVTDKNDLRRNIGTLTSKGEKLVRDSTKALDEIDRKMYDGFSDQDRAA
jgi:MarR family transcriptional regulator for hemolysin